MDFLGLAVESMLSVFSPNCACCGALVLPRNVSINDETSGYDRTLVLDIVCWGCGARGKVVLEYLRTYIHDLEGPFKLNEKINFGNSRKKRIARTKLPKPIEEKEIMLEVWTILNKTR